MAYAAWSVVFGEQPSAAKWNILGTNDSSFNDGTGIANGKILPNHLLTSASSLNTHVWDSWTPTWTNLTISSSSVVGAYIQIGKTVHFRLKVVSAGSFAISGDVEFTLPVSPKTSSAYVADDTIGYGQVLDSSAGIRFFAQLWIGTVTTRGRIIVWDDNNSAYLRAAGLSSSLPMTWAVPDEIRLAGTYEAA